jgi:cytochrome c biogenesis protein CcmG/thiol:disulfide interchange protein DsbE
MRQVPQPGDPVSGNAVPQAATASSRRKLLGLAPLGGFALLSALLAAGLRLKPREVPSPLIGQPAPDFDLPHLHDAAQRVSPAQMRGQVWLLNVWASWCAPCRTEHPLLVAVARDAGVPLLGLSYKDDPRSAQEWLRALGDPYRAVAVDREGRAAIDYGVYGVPETFVIDRAGLVRHKHVGPLTPQAWAGELQPLIRRLQG